jgi:hypothetical protein
MRAVRLAPTSHSSLPQKNRKKFLKRTKENKSKKVHFKNKH